MSKRQKAIQKMLFSITIINLIENAKGKKYGNNIQITKPNKISRKRKKSIKYKLIKFFKKVNYNFNLLNLIFFLIF